MENNISISMHVKRKILDSNGDRYNEDMIVVTGNAGNSIALRNAIFAVVPEWITDKIYAAAKEKIIGDVSDEVKFKAKVKKAFDKLMGRYNVTEKEILDAIGRGSIEHIVADDFITLAGIETAIKNGDTKPEYVFKKAKDPVSTTLKEDRLITTIKNCATVQQLESFKSRCRTAAENSAYEDKLTELKTKQNGN
jgi:hypothetical protein